MLTSPLKPKMVKLTRVWKQKYQVDQVNEIFVKISTRLSSKDIEGRCKVFVESDDRQNDNLS